MENSKHTAKERSKQIKKEEPKIVVAVGTLPKPADRRKFYFCVMSRETPGSEFLVLSNEFLVRKYRRSMNYLSICGIGGFKVDGNRTTGWK